MNHDHLNHQHLKVVEGPVGKQLTRMTLPLILGLVSIMLFNVVDTFWLAKLGTTELAAISFIFPIAFLLISLSLGLSVATSSVVSRTIGEGDLRQVKRLTSCSLLLSFHIILVVAILGLLTIRPLFTLLGADEQVLVPIHDYLVIWYSGVVFLVLPMVSNGAIRATGDTKTPGIIMATSALTNAVLDPLLIFGWGPVPSFGVRGAAMSSVISWTAAMLMAFTILSRRYGMVDFRPPGLSELIQASKRILKIALPAMATQILIPISTAVLTAMVAQFGPKSVAAYGVGSRIEPLALVVMLALSSALNPFVGQNWGAGKGPRVRHAYQLAVRFAFLWEGALCLILIAASAGIGGLFSSDPVVYALIISFLWIIPISYGFQGVLIISAAVFNALHEPLKATSLNVLRLIGFCIPFGLYGAQVAGVRGIFFAIGLANICTGTIAYLWIRRAFKLKFAEAG